MRKPCMVIDSGCQYMVIDNGCRLFIVILWLSLHRFLKKKSSENKKFKVVISVDVRYLGHHKSVFDHLLR